MNSTFNKSFVNASMDNKLEYEERFLVYHSYTVIDNHNMIEEIRVSIVKIKISNVNMYILCDFKGKCLNHDHVAHLYKYMGAECSKLRQHVYI